MADKMWICGLTDYEKEEVRKYKGQCNACMHLDWKGKDFCDKKREFLDERMVDCDDWLLDTR